MIIDFHTHVFPDELASKALSVLCENIDYIYTPVHDGTLMGLLNKMAEWEIDLSVVQPVVTKPSQMKKTNEWASSICSDHILSFGGIYPHSDDYKRDIDFVVNLGLKGIKFHAEYQNFTIDEDKMLKIYDYALSRDLIIIHHAGIDPGMPKPYKSSPRQFARIADAMKGGIIVAAHFGGHAQWDEVEEHLAGKDIYLDTSMGFEYYSPDQFVRIVQKHGADKILFASDSPWSNAKDEIEMLKAMPLSEEDKNKIFYDNAKRILKL